MPDVGVEREELAKENLLRETRNEVEYSLSQEVSP
jgi:hypothetical protein